MTDAGGSYCPACEQDSGVDAEDWWRRHERTDPAVCVNCGAKLRAYYDEYPDDWGGFWAFEPVEDAESVPEQSST